MMLCSGQCSHKIDVQTVAETRTADGGFTEAYTHSFYTRGNFLGMTGKEYFESAQTMGSATYKVTIRSNTSTRAMTLKDRLSVTVKGTTRVFNIVSMVPDARCREFLIIAVEAVA